MSYEIEIKALIGDKSSADVFRDRLMKLNSVEFIGRNKQRNHYFVGNNNMIIKLYDNFANIVPESLKDKFYKITHGTEEFSVRTREINGDTVILVIKASIDDTTSENGIARMEVEITVPMTLSELDESVLQSGFEYQAKWSREREEYKLGDINISLDKNAGYGYLAEFEKVLENENDAKEAEHELRTIMAKLEVEELSQDQLARMFEYYNKNWWEYYETEKIFTIE